MAKAPSPKNSAPRKNQFFALEPTGDLVSIHEVPRGLSCACVCPKCKATLVAKHGTKKVWHFAHASTPDMPGCAETALHLAGKQALLTLQSLLLPPSQLTVSQDDVYGLGHHRSRGVPGRAIRVLSAELEVERGTRRLDAVLQTSIGPVGVEIRVWHAVDADKHQDLVSGDLPVLEIDLSALLELPTAPSWAEVAESVRGHADRRSVGNETLLAPQEYSAMRASVAAETAAANRLAERVLTPTPADQERAAELSSLWSIPLTEFSRPAPAEVQKLWGSKFPGERVTERPFGTDHVVWRLALANVIRARGAFALDQANPLTANGLAQDVVAALGAGTNRPGQLLREEGAIMALLANGGVCEGTGSLVLQACQAPPADPADGARFQKRESPRLEILDTAQTASLTEFRALTRAEKFTAVMRWSYGNEAPDVTGFDATQRLSNPEPFGVPQAIWTTHLYLGLILPQRAADRPATTTHIAAAFAWLCARYLVEDPAEAAALLDRYLRVLERRKLIVGQQNEFAGDLFEATAEQRGWNAFQVCQRPGRKAVLPEGVV